MSQKTEEMSSQVDDKFAEDVQLGLSSSPKHIPSKYFYNQKGDELFQAIMKMPEYYLTDCEFEIFTMNRDKLMKQFGGVGDEFDLVELGAGDGLKTKVLLKHFTEHKVSFKYVPIDISQNAIDELLGDLESKIPSLQTEGFQGEYFDALAKVNVAHNARKVILFLGSNIGNFGESEAAEFMKSLGDLLSNDDLVMIGFDLKKDPEIIERAYNDKGGITRAFNLNLLDRINEEFDGNFDKEQFKHFPFYNPSTGEMKSYLVSLKPQTVELEKLGVTYQFDAWEPIFMEVSQKYDLKCIDRIAKKSGFKVVDNIFDCKHYFVNSIWQLS